MIPVEAIQRVIEDLEYRRYICGKNGSYNRADAFETAITKLEEVVAQHATDNSNRADGHGENDDRDGQTDSV